MSFINYTTREINLKIVYAGPAFSGRLTSMEHIYRHTAPERRGKMISLTSAVGRNCFFDFIPSPPISLRGFTTRFHLYTVPGTVFPTPGVLAELLRGVDAVIFVLWGTTQGWERNPVALELVETALGAQGKRFKALPHIWQLNRRDLLDAVPIATARNWVTDGAPLLETSTREGWGVFESLAVVARWLIDSLRAGKSSSDPSTIGWNTHDDQALLDCLHETKPFSERIRALEELVSRESPSTLRALRACSGDPQPHVRARTMELATCVPLPETIEILWQGSIDKHPLVFEKAVQGLCKHRPHEILTSLRNELVEAVELPRLRIAMNAIAGERTPSDLGLFESVAQREPRLREHVQNCRLRMAERQ